MIFYKIAAAISLFVRIFLLPDPFECFGDYALLINIIVETPIHFLTYKLVGTIYSRGECPPLGAFLYLITYCSVIGILCLMGLFSFAWWWILIISIAFGLLFYGIHSLKERFRR